MADDHAPYHRGEMEISEQVSTFHGFIELSKWGSLVVAIIVLFPTLLLCAHAGLMQSFLACAVLAVLGFLMLRSKPGAGH